MPKFRPLRWLRSTRVWQQADAWSTANPKAAVVVRLAVGWLVLNAMVNLRAPLPEAPLSYLVPSVDITVVLTAFALVGAVATYGAVRVAWLGKLAVPAVVLWLLALVVAIARIFRFGDGIAETFQSRPANLFLDVPMLGELTRLLYNTMPLYQFVLVLAGVAVIVPLLIAVAYLAWRACATALRQRVGLLAFVGAMGFLLLASRFFTVAGKEERFVGVFATSLLPRTKTDLLLFIETRELQQRRRDAREHARTRFGQTSADLKLLGGANVLLFLVESYGATTLTEPFYEREINELYASLEESFSTNGFSIASHLLDSSTNGGNSWLAQSTLMTGIRISNQSDFIYFTQTEPVALPSFFKGAGYYTVAAEPGATRPITGHDLFKFDRKIIAPSFGYAGPKFSWSRMPDQFVIHVVHRRVIALQRRPVFAMYALTSSHGPWNLQPQVIEDWREIKNGAIYGQLPKIEFPTSWTDLSEARGPYMHSVAYSMDVIRRYALEFIADDTLVIMLGDHQPTGQITDHTKDNRVPIHVVSRNPGLVDKFLKRGYTPHIRPNLDVPAQPMEDFPGDLVTDFSTP